MRSRGEFFSDVISWKLPVLLQWEPTIDLYSLNNALATCTGTSSSFLRRISRTQRWRELVGWRRVPLCAKSNVTSL